MSTPNKKKRLGPPCLPLGVSLQRNVPDPSRQTKQHKTQSSVLGTKCVDVSEFSIQSWHPTLAFSLAIPLFSAFFRTDICFLLLLTSLCLFVLTFASTVRAPLLRLAASERLLRIWNCPFPILTTIASSLSQTHPGPDRQCHLGGALAV